MTMRKLNRRSPKRVEAGDAHLERGFEAVGRGHAIEMERPSWWTYPTQCENGHVWGPAV